MQRLNNNNAFFVLALISILFIAGCTGTPQTGTGDTQQTEDTTPPDKATNTADENMNTEETTESAAPNEEITTPPQEESGRTHTVEMRITGFTPETLKIKQGDTVMFVNKDTSPTWPASAVHPTHTVYPGSSSDKCGTGALIFDACRGLAQDEVFSFTFDEEGAWKYHDHLNPGITGTIEVIP